MDSQQLKDINATLLAMNTQLGAMMAVQKTIIKFLATDGGMKTSELRLAIVAAIKLHASTDNPHSEIWSQIWEEIRNSLPK
jgi:hypothetical protein